MIIAKQEGELYEIRFNYDPEVVNLVKMVPGRRWVPESKMWTIPNDRLGHLINQLRGTPYEAELTIYSNDHINEPMELESTRDIEDVDLTGINLYIQKGLTLYKHQIEFMQYALHRERIGLQSGFILGDQQGLGKTIETINYALYLHEHCGAKHCLILCCINSSKYNWETEVNKHTNGKYKGYILGTRRKRNGEPNKATGSKEKLEDLTTGMMFGGKVKPNLLLKKKDLELPYFIIMNIEGLRHKVKRTYPIADRIIEMIENGEINMIAIDEVHRNTSPSSQTGNQLLKIKRKTGSAVRWLPITGTPMINHPTDVFLPLGLVDGHTMTSFYKWKQEFCIYGGYGGREIVGYKNLPRLKAMLQANMLRRLKSEVLDLPPKLFYTEYVENTKYQKRLYDGIEDYMRENSEEMLAGPNPLVAFLRLRQVNGSPELVDSELQVDNTYLSKNAKMTRALEMIDDITENGEKVIMFSNWVEPLRTFYRFVSRKHKTCVFTGTMSEQARQANKQRFIEDPEYTVMIATIGAMGTTHSFPGCKHMIFYDTPWTYVDREQAEDRIHGLSRGIAGESAIYYTLISIDTVDERVWNIMYGKKITSDYIVDGHLDLKSNPSLYFKLLGGK